MRYPDKEQTTRLAASSLVRTIEGLNRSSARPISQPDPLSLLGHCDAVAMLIDERFACVRSTPKTRDWLGQNECLHIVRRRLTCPADPLGFRRMMMLALGGAIQDFEVREPSADGVWSLRGLPYQLCCGAMGVLVIVREGQPSSNVTASRVRGLLGLTRAESELVAALCNGMTTSQFAHERRLSIHTVRNHLKAIYGKLAVHSQKDLIAEALRRTLTAETRNASALDRLAVRRNPSAAVNPA